MNGPFDQFSKALIHADRLRSIAQNAIPAPVSVKLELTNACNHDCHFCAYGRIVQAPQSRASLPTERVLSLIDELAANDVRAVMLTGGGEPLAHAGAAKVIDRCRERKLSHALITNGTLVDRLSDDSLRGLRWIRFSINAGTAASYAAIHGADEGDWGRVWTQVARAASLDGPDVGVSFVVTARNVDDVEQAAQRAKESGADYIHLRPAFEGPHTTLDRQLRRRESEATIARIDALSSLETQAFRVYGVERRFRELHAPEREHIHCRATPLVAYVLPTGDLSICTMVRAKDFNRDVSDPFLGNLRDADFFSLWNTPKHRDLIAALSRSDCKRCHFSEYNRALSMIERDAFHKDFL